MIVGFIGLGTMGRNVALNIRRVGFAMVVHDLRQEASEPLIEAGASWASTPLEVMERCDVVVTMVFGPREIEQVARAENGMFATDCTNKFWIDLTTSEPRLMRNLGEDFARLGGTPIDAPVTGSVDSAIRGDMLMFVGGDEAQIETVRPVIESMGQIRRVGPHGTGYVAKLVNNQLWMIHAAAIGEAMVAAKLSGLEPEIWWEAMKGGAADSFVMQHDVPSIFAGHYDPSFPLALCLKDLQLIEDLASETGTRSELTRATHKRFKEAHRLYGDSAGELSVCRQIEEEAGVSLRVAGNWTPPWEIVHS